MTIAVILSVSTVFAQDDSEGGMLRRSKEYQATYRNDGRYRENDHGLLNLPGFGLSEDYDAGTPLGSGIAVLLGLGAAYLVGKKRRED